MPRRIRLAAVPAALGFLAVGAVICVHPALAAEQAATASTSSSSAASTAPTPSVAEIEAEISRDSIDGMVDTIDALEAAGLNELDPKFAGLTTMINEGTYLAVHYSTQSKYTEEIRAIIESVAQTAPVQIVATPMDMTPSHVQDIARRLASPNDEFGIIGDGRTVTVVEFGHTEPIITVHVRANDDASREVTSHLIEGVRVEVVADNTSFVLSSRNDDSAQ